MQGRYSSANRGQKRPLAREPSTWRIADTIWNVWWLWGGQEPSERLWETCWQLQPAVRMETNLNVKANKFPSCIFLCSPPASAKPKVNPFSRQWLKAEAFVFSVALVNSFARDQSMNLWRKDRMQPQLYYQLQILSLTWFSLLLVLLYLFIGPGSTRLELNEKLKELSVSVNAIFLSLESQHKANCSPEFLKLSSTYEITFIIFIPTFFSPNILVLQVLQLLLFFSPKLDETQEISVLSFFECSKTYKNSFYVHKFLI